MLSHSFALMITGYQKYLSPYKGFCCAHRVWHGGDSCSEFVRQTLLQEGVLASIPKTRLRFQECKVAAMALSDNSGNKNARRLRRQRRHKDCDSFCATCNVLPDTCSLLDGVDVCGCSL